MLHIAKGSVIAVIGCGGKTSLIKFISDKFRDKKVLVSPTTKMFPIKGRNVTLYETLSRCMEHEPGRGVQCMGLLNASSGKLEALPEDFFAELVSRYDITLLEADGSRGLPCKGWLDNEPVIPPYCTHTIGVITMKALGKAATETVVHNLPEFLALTGLKKGEKITEQALVAMVCAPAGMFKNSVGRRYLLVNGAESDKKEGYAQSFLCTIKRLYPDRFEKLLYGSIHLDLWQEA